MANIPPLPDISEYLKPPPFKPPALPFGDAIDLFSGRTMQRILDRGPLSQQFGIEIPKPLLDLGDAAIRMSWGTSGWPGYSPQETLDVVRNTANSPKSAGPTPTFKQVESSAELPFFENGKKPVLTTGYGAASARTGEPHYGEDYGAPEGTPIVAPADMTIQSAYTNAVVGDRQANQMWGNQIKGVMQSPDGTPISIAFSHLRDVHVQPGQTVRKGQVIGTVGNTGWSTGPHLDVRTTLAGQNFAPSELASMLGGEGGGRGQGPSGIPDISEYLRPPAARPNLPFNIPRIPTRQDYGEMRLPATPRPPSLDIPSFRAPRIAGNPYASRIRSDIWKEIEAEEKKRKQGEPTEENIARELNKAGFGFVPGAVQDILRDAQTYERDAWFQTQEWIATAKKRWATAKRDLESPMLEVPEDERKDFMIAYIKTGKRPAKYMVGMAEEEAQEGTATDKEFKNRGITGTQAKATAGPDYKKGPRPTMTPKGVIERAGDVAGAIAGPGTLPADIAGGLANLLAWPFDRLNDANKSWVESIIGKPVDEEYWEDLRKNQDLLMTLGAAPMGITGYAKAGAIKSAMRAPAAAREAPIVAEAARVPAGPEVPAYMRRGVKVAEEASSPVTPEIPPVAAGIPDDAVARFRNLQDMEGQLEAKHGVGWMQKPYGQMSDVEKADLSSYLAYTEMPATERAVFQAGPKTMQFSPGESAVWKGQDVTVKEVRDKGILIEVGKRGRVVQPEELTPKAQATEPLIPEARPPVAGVEPPDMTPQGAPLPEPPKPPMAPEGVAKPAAQAVESGLSKGPGAAQANVYDRVVNSLEPEVPYQTVGERVKGAVNKVKAWENHFEDEVTDKMHYVEQVGSRVKNKDLKNRIAASYGMEQKAVVEFSDLIDTMAAAVGKENFNPQDVQALLKLEHAKEIFTQHPKRIAVGEINSMAETVSGLAQMEQTLGPERWAAAKRAMDVYSDFMAKRVVDRSVGTFLTAKDAKTLKDKYQAYYRLNYLDNIEEMADYGGTATNPARIFKKLSEIGIEAQTQAPFEAGLAQLMNFERRMEANTLLRQTWDAVNADPQWAGKYRFIGPKAGPLGTGELGMWIDGQRQVVKLPPEIYKDFTQKESHGILSRVIAAASGVTRAGAVKYNPAWIPVNVAGDALTSLLTEGLIPGQSLPASWRYLMGGLKNDPNIQKFALSGALQQRYFGESAKLAKDIVAQGGHVAPDVRSLVTKVKDAIVNTVPAIGEALEQGTRVKIYEKAMDKLLPAWRTMDKYIVAETPQSKEAARRALEGTIRFSRGGHAIKNIDPMSIFLNVGIQGSTLPIRVLRDNPAARWRIGTFAGATAALTAYNMSYPEYFDVDPSIRRGSVMFMLPSEKTDIKGKSVANYWTIIPKTREWTQISGSVIYLMEKFLKDSPEDAQSFLGSIAGSILPVTSLPLPPLLEEVFEQQANWDFYRGKKMVPGELERLPVEEQVTSFTSPTIAAVAPMLGQSPVRAEHAVTNIFGGAARVALSFPDYVIKNLMPPKEYSPEATTAKEEVMSISPEQRTSYMAKLPKAVREEVQKMIREPQADVPVLGAMQRRFVPQRTATYDSEAQDQTRAYFSDVQEQEAVRRQKVEENDQRLIAKQVTPKIWKERNKEINDFYYSIVESLHGQKDKEGKDISRYPLALVTGDEREAYNKKYGVRDFPVTDVDLAFRKYMQAKDIDRNNYRDPVTDEIDWKKVDKGLEEYWANYSPQERATLEPEFKQRRLANLSGAQQVYDKALDEFKQLQKIPRWITGSPAKQEQWEKLYRTYLDASGDEKKRLMVKNPVLHALLSKDWQNPRRQMFKKAHPLIDEFF